jgi:hypothetical protein
MLMTCFSSPVYQAILLLSGCQKGSSQSRIDFYKNRLHVLLLLYYLLVLPCIISSWEIIFVGFVLLESVCVCRLSSGARIVFHRVASGIFQIYIVYSSVPNPAGIPSFDIGTSDRVSREVSTSLLH